MAIRYGTVDDGGAFCKVVLEEPGDVITFAREACADPKKWDLFEAPMLQRLLVIFQERLEEARSCSFHEEVTAAEERGVSRGIAMENARQRSQADRSILVGAQIKAELKALAQGKQGGIKSLLRRLMVGPSGSSTRAAVLTLKGALRAEVERHEAAATRLRRVLRSA